MQKFFSTFFLITLLFIVLTKVAFCESMIQNIPDFSTVFKLLEKQTELDQKQITFQGEIVGQPLFEKKGVFINIMDPEFNALGVYLEKPMLSQIKIFGRYGQTGDYVKVEGIFHKVCAQHGGDTDLHATTVSVLQVGKQIPEPKIPPFVVILSLLLPLLAFILFKFLPDKQ